MQLKTDFFLKQFLRTDFKLLNITEDSRVNALRYMWKQSKWPSRSADSRPRAMVTPARAGMAGPAVVTGATGRNTNHTTDSFLTAGRKRNKEDESLDIR